MATTDNVDREILTWLRATIEDDQEAARDLPHGPWRRDGIYPQRIGNAEAILIAETYTDPSWPADIADHIVLHDPQDAINRCEFELEEIARHAVHIASEYEVGFPCDYLRRHAYGYRHRPGWKPSWAPEGQEAREEKTSSHSTRHSEPTSVTMLRPS